MNPFAKLVFQITKNLILQHFYVAEQVFGLFPLSRLQAALVPASAVTFSQRSINYPRLEKFPPPAHSNVKQTFHILIPLSFNLPRKIEQKKKK